MASYEDGNNASSPVANGNNEPGSPSAPRTSSTIDPVTTAATTTTTTGAASSGPPKHVEDVMYSDIGISTLLTRLKQSIASARDFAAFLKKRSGLEEEQAMGLKRLARSNIETVRRAEVRSGTYASQLAEVLRVHELMSDNGMQFALSLHQMHEDLNELSNNMERGRKQWKHEGLDAEKRASDAEQLMQKAKARYDSFAESYDRARTGDSKGSRRIGLKGPKSAEQHEQDLLQKVAAADTDYEDKVRQARSSQEHLISTSRPQAVRALRELIQECDNGLTLQLQKYATFNEKLLLGNGLAISPLADKEATGGQKSMRDIIAGINNDNDYNLYVGSHVGKISRPSDIKYEKHPTLAPKQQNPTSYTAPLTVNTVSQPNSMNSRQQPVNTSPATFSPAQTQNTPTKAAYQQPYAQVPSQYQPASQGQHPSTSQGQYQTALPGQYSSVSQGQYPSASQGQYSSASQGQYPPASQAQYTSPSQGQHPSASQAQYQQPTQSVPSAYQQAPYPVHPAERSVAQPTPAYTQPIAAPAVTTPMASRPVFGLTLEELFNRDEEPVPIIVSKCMQAVELFGLDVEGIYRLSGTSRLVVELREAFDNNPPNSPKTDFRNPANFYHDVNSVATLLKQFFRDLPDPLFPKHAYNQFIDSARIEDEYGRRDALHQLINDLPDPNYATLRAVVLHLHRVMQHENRNRMGASNLAICFAPSLMGAHSGPQIADAGLQAKVLDNILSNATAIFDED